VEVLDKVMSPAVLVFLIPIVAILAFFGRKMLDRYFDHQERMAKIEAGIDPDSRPDED